MVWMEGETEERGRKGKEKDSMKREGNGKKGRQDINYLESTFHILNSMMPYEVYCEIEWNHLSELWMSKDRLKCQKVQGPDY